MLYVFMNTCYIHKNMSVNVKIPFKNLEEVPIKSLFRNNSRYNFGVRDEQMRIKTNAVSQTTVIFDCQKIGRGIELTLEDRGIELRLCAPSSTSDLELFLDLISIAVQASTTKEIICEDEALSIEKSTRFANWLRLISLRHSILF